MSTYTVLTERVTHQNIDGEVIAIHFNTGVYYSMTGSAATIWGQLGDGATIEQIVGTFKDAPVDAAATVERFLDRLVSEDLVGCREDVEPRSAPSTGISWSEPRLEKFTDMSDLIMADPIHDVDEMGWPSLAQPGGDDKT